ncbi:Non-ribosomal peptide synthetase/alpha-aminoadipate reductase and related enzymes [Ceraceosorus bombacis]|uniref:Non-ribosomal peptide synthetase/alpha-aminoadipate reductase and related enzymes n=1 Tax=Ceraceosorus bombacis TaxID=401625 RepID=A0A0P1BDX3_9BASI|nr:Non-ribosomal peptide synthetase/alpha-aminoadipate reductase and related enzymes [Ceraceosorus bombacis]
MAVADRILFSATSRDAPAAPDGVQTLPDLFEWQARARPSATLYSFRREEGADVAHKSYREVYEQVLGLADALARLFLHSHGAASTSQQRAPVVGIWFEKSIELHLAMHTSTFCGATWLPFDADAPTSRVTACLDDSRAAVLLCDAAHFEAAKQAAANAPHTMSVVLIDDLMAEARKSSPITSARPRYPRSTDAAYMIYTSGSTGKPKGIEISHGAALVFSLSERLLLNTGPEDIVWQGFSFAFDMSIEETWVSIAGGAHLAIGSRAECQNVPGLGGAHGVWAKRGVTVVNAVPTLINIMTSLDDECSLPPSVRLLNLGGEACPPALVNRLWHPNLRIWNTYGPSETTVTATIQELFPNEAVTIGKPLPSYHAVLLPIADDYDSSDAIPKEPLALVAGAEGELAIGGPCVGNGYVGRPELTAEKFIPHPLWQGTTERMYRTGDRVKLDFNHNLLFLGRIDTQVKHRGFRIELGEIENALALHPDVQTAAVILSGVSDRLEAYLVMRRPDAASASVDSKAFKGSLSGLPGYMQPEAFFVLGADEMPRLPSGKINAKALQEVSKAKADEEKARQAAAQEVATEKAGNELAAVDPASELGVLLRALSAVFPQAVPILPNSDFFEDLGGHSLAAAMLVSKLRKECPSESPLRTIGMQDIYLYRTAQQISARFAVQSEDNDSSSDYDGADEKHEASSLGGPSGAQTGEHWEVSTLRYWLCGFFQVPALLFFWFIQSIEYLVPYLIFFVALHARGIGAAIVSTYAVFIALPIFLSLVGVLGKWLALGKAKPGEYPLYGLYYYRWWLAERFVELADLHNIADTVLMPSILRGLGARVGSHCHLGFITTGAALDLIEIGDDVVIGQDVVLSTSIVERGRLILKPLRIGNDARVGSNSVIEGGASIEDGAEVAALTMVPDGMSIPTAQRWHGSPAQFFAESEDVGNMRQTRPSDLRRSLMGLAMSFTVVFVFPILYFAPQIPSLLMFEVLNIRHLNDWQQTGIVAVPAALAYLCLVFLELVVFRWIVLGPLREGTHRTTSVFYFRKWATDRIMDMSLSVLHPVYATLYVVPFLRALGVKIGRMAEVSTARGINFELTEIGDESFIADGVLMGDTDVRNNMLKLKKTTLAPRAFAGNASLLPQGTHLASNTLVGVLSIAPPAEKPLQEGQSCFGSPPVMMPARAQGATCYADHLLYSPKAWQVALRIFIEGLRIVLPRALIVFGLGYGLEIFETAYPYIGVWTLVGVYKPAEWPLWSKNVWLSEFVTSTYETLAMPLLTAKLVGTPFLPWCFRLLGVQIGKKVTMLSMDITEYDLVSLGDEAVINRHAGPQTHLFQDRRMGMDRVDLESRATMMPYSILLPNSRIAEGGQLGSLSLVMKGESVPAGEAWEGAPIAPRRRRRRAPFAAITDLPKTSGSAGDLAKGSPDVSLGSSMSSAAPSLRAPRAAYARPRGDGSRDSSNDTTTTMEV